MLLQAVADKYTKSSDNHEWKQTKNNNNPKPNKAIDCSSCYVRLWVFKTDFIMKILLTTNEEIICKNIEFESKEVIVTLFDNTIRYFDRVDLVSIIEYNESIELLDGLVSDVGNLLCDVADLDFEWQQAGYYETAKVFLKTLQDDNESMNFHECSECNIRCNCTTSECSCSCRTES